MQGTVRGASQEKGETQEAAGRQRQRVDRTGLYTVTVREARRRGRQRQRVDRTGLSTVTVRGARRRGRHRKRRGDSVREWTGLDFTQSL